MTDHDHISTLKDAADPQRIAAALGLQGRGRRFLCPSCQPHGGTTPDLVIGDKGFICHKYGEKGDLLKPIEVVGNMDFPSAAAWLEGETGIVRPPVAKKGRASVYVIWRGRDAIVDPGASCGATTASIHGVRT